MARSVAIPLAFSLWGCGGGSSDGLDHRAVSGKVTLDGAPLAKGVIAFAPADGSPGAIPAGGVITDGYYSIDSTSGPTPGKYRVSIRSASADAGPAEKAAPGAPPPRRKKEAGDPIPAKYNSESELTTEVGSGGASPADFALVTK